MSVARSLLLTAVAWIISAAIYLLAGRSLIYGGTALALSLPFVIFLSGAPAAARQRPGSGRAVVICGPAGSGKTTLFLRLSGKRQVAENGSQCPLTAPSATVNKGKLVEQQSPPITLLDVPGNEKARDRALTETLPAASKLLLLFDATAADGLPAEAPFIARVLAESISKQVPCALVLGKSDLCTNDPEQFVRLLDEALVSLCRRMTNSPEDAGSDLGEHLRRIQKHLGIDAEDPISFSTLDIPVMSCNCKDEQSLAQLKAWISDV